MNYPEFYERRRDELDHRLHWLEGATEDEIRHEMNVIWENFFDVTNSEILWELFSGIDQCLVSLAVYLNSFLVGICNVFAQTSVNWNY